MKDCLCVCASFLSSRALTHTDTLAHTHTHTVLRDQTLDTSAATSATLKQEPWFHEEEGEEEKR